MELKTQIRELFVRLYKAMNGLYDAEIKDLNEQLKEIAGNLEACYDANQSLKEAEEGYVSVLASLKKISDEAKLRGIALPESFVKFSESIRDKYPEADITYTGYVIKLKGRTLRPAIRLQDFIQVLPSHRLWVEERGLTFRNYMEKYSDLELGEVFNLLVFDLFKAYVGRKTYKLDSILYGVNEQWAPALDTWHLMEMDCEDSSKEFHALTEAAGLVGPFKSFIWNVGGLTHSGFGHETIHVYDFRDGFYRHLETTKTRERAANFHKLPPSSSKHDKLNFQSIWWSFNSECSRHKFITEEDKMLYEERNEFKDIVIAGVEA